MTQSETYLNQLLLDFERWRDRKNYTQGEVAEELGITRAHLNKVVNKKTLPSLQLLQKIEELIQN